MSHHGQVPKLPQALGRFWYNRAAMSKQYLGYTKNNLRVFVDTESSHATAHITDDPALLALIPGILASTLAIDGNIYFDKDMGRVVGKCDLVETRDDDQIVYAKRRNRNNYARFVLNRAPEQTSFITLALNRVATGEYELKSVWFGRLAPQFPGDNGATEESGPFWRRHALAWGTQVVQEGTKTNFWPWD